MRSKLKIITAFIIGVIVSGITVYAANKIYSNQVEIDKTGGKLANVNGTKLQDALDYLYQKANQVGTCPTGYECSKVATISSELQVGDLVKMKPTLSSFTTVTAMTGYSSAQTINPQELEYWRVIRKNGDGTVDVVSEYVSSEAIYFNGVNGYKNFIGYLNTLASKYENSNYTVGSRHMGYDSTKATEYLTSTSKFDGTSNAKPWTTSTSSSIAAADEALGAGDMGYETDYDLVVKTYRNTIVGGTSGFAQAYKVGTTTLTRYWLASRYYEVLDRPEKYFYFRVRYIDSSSASIVKSYSLRYYNASNTTQWGTDSISMAIRPVLTLKSTIPLNNIEQGTKAYILD